MDKGLTNMLTNESPPKKTLVFLRDTEKCLVYYNTGRIFHSSNLLWYIHQEGKDTVGVYMIPFADVARIEVHLMTEEEKECYPISP